MADWLSGLAGGMIGAGSVLSGGSPLAGLSVLGHTQSSNDKKNDAIAAEILNDLIDKEEGLTKENVFPALAKAGWKPSSLKNLSYITDIIGSERKEQRAKLDDFDKMITVGENLPEEVIPAYSRATGATPGTFDTLKRRQAKATLAKTEREGLKDLTADEAVNMMVRIWPDKQFERKQGQEFLNLFKETGNSLFGSTKTLAERFMEVGTALAPKYGQPVNIWEPAPTPTTQANQMLGGGGITPSTSGTVRTTTPAVTPTPTTVPAPSIQQNTKLQDIRAQFNAEAEQIAIQNMKQNPKLTYYKALELAAQQLKDAYIQRGMIE